VVSDFIGFAFSKSQSILRGFAAAEIGINL